MERKQLGNFGEKIAENYLKNKRYKILDKNYSFRVPGNPQKGEIDIIARKEKTISFIEVKTLRKEECGAFFPEEKVDFLKQKKIIRTAEIWLSKNKIPLNSKWQIDIIAIETDRENKIKINHFENIAI